MIENDFDRETQPDNAPPLRAGYRQYINIARKGFQLAAFLASFALLVWFSVWGYDVFQQEKGEIFVIKAPAAPVRILPEDPGGIVTSYADLHVNEIINDQLPNKLSDKVLLAPSPIELVEGEDIAGLGASLSGLDTQSLYQTPATDTLDNTFSPVSDNDVAGLPFEVKKPDVIGGSSDLKSSFRDSELNNDDGLNDRESLIKNALLEALYGDGAATAGEVAQGAVEPMIVQAGYIEQVGDEGEKTFLQRARPRPNGPEDDIIKAQSDALQKLVISALDTKGRSPFELDYDTLSAGTPVAQLGALISLEQAREEWVRISNRFRSLFQGRFYIVQPVEVRGVRFFRLRVVRFKDEAEAQQFCASLEAANTPCIASTYR